MTINITHTISMQVSNTATLDELKEFIAAVEASGITSPVVRFTTYAGDQRDPGYTTITGSPGGRR